MDKRDFESALHVVAEKMDVDPLELIKMAIASLGARPPSEWKEPEDQPDDLPYEGCCADLDDLVEHVAGAPVRLRVSL